MLLLPEGGAKHGFLKLLGCEDLLECCYSSDLDEAPMVVVLGDGKEQLQSRLHTLAHHEDARLVAAVGAVSERLVEGLRRLFVTPYVSDGHRRCVAGRGHRAV